MELLLLGQSCSLQTNPLTGKQKGLLLSLFISSDIVPRISVSCSAGGVGGGVWLGGGLLSSHLSSGCLLPTVRTESPDSPLGFHTGPDFAHHLPYLPVSPQARESSSLPRTAAQYWIPLFMFCFHRWQELGMLFLLSVLTGASVNTMLNHMRDSERFQGF